IRVLHSFPTRRSSDLLGYITDGLQVFRRVTINFILSQSQQVNTNDMGNILENVDHWVEPIIRQLVNEYSGSWEHTVSLQRVALRSEEHTSELQSRFDL